ncbi:hypothetical protein KJ866_01150 [Patescibacteria group bacterium]|nr:hypothetical protein [Patescibacteria group bacterium]MBU2264936.1 hypothetical protein [Patescibacteria group bacterium]
MNKKVLFKVAEVKGKLMFKTGKLFLSNISAFDFFEGGRLSIYRNGELIDETEAIEYETYAACVCFIGLKGRNVSSGISCDGFQVGDSISVSFSCKRTFSIQKFLQVACFGKNLQEYTKMVKENMW